MTAIELIEKIKQCLIKGDLKKGLGLLDESIRSGSELCTESILLMGRYSRFCENERKEIGSKDEIEREFRTISNILLKLCKEVTDDEVKIGGAKNLLVICKDDSDEFYMREFFRRMQLKEYDIKLSNTYHNPTNYHLMIFDNHSCPTHKPIELTNLDNVHLNRMQEYFDKVSDVYFIHFGTQYALLSDVKYRERMHMANSKFALYSRIKEMQEYIQKDLIYGIKSKYQ